MIIGDAKLVQGLIDNLSDLTDLAPGPQAQALLKSSQTIAFELRRRSDVVDATRRYAAGRHLLLDAAASAFDPARHLVLTQLLAELPATLPAQLDSESSDALFESIRRGICACFRGSRYPHVTDARLARVLEAMSDWERAGYALGTPAGDAESRRIAPIAVEAAMLQRFLRSRYPADEAAAVTGLTPIAGGFSKQTVLFDVQIGDRLEGYVYRGTARIQIIEPVLVDIAQEFHVVAYAFSRGAAVAEPLWLQADDSGTGVRFLISRRAAGRTLGTAVAAHEPVPAAVTRALGGALARIHALPLDPDNEHLRASHLKTAAAPALQDVIRRRVDDWAGYFRSLKAPTFPALELAFEWLLDNVPEPDGDLPVLVHGDYGLHNILVHEDRVSAVLDWEACHIGDRALDLSHILAGTAGKMDHGAFMDAYIAAGGRAVSQFRLAYYQVLMNMQFMLSTIDAQHLFERRAGAGTQFCTLGLGFIEYTANNVLNGIRRAGATGQSRRAP